MDYKILYDNYGSSIAVELDDGRTAMIDIMDKTGRFEEMGIILANGMWEEWEGDLAPEIDQTVQEILKSLK